MTGSRGKLLAALVVASFATTRADAQRDASWELRIPERMELVAGAGGTLPITIVLDRGLTISRDAALIVDLTPDAAIAIKRRRLGRADAVDPDAGAPRFSIALRSDTPGDFGVRVRLRFWVCGKRVCRPAEARRNVAIAVLPPPPTPATP